MILPLVNTSQMSILSNPLRILYVWIRRLVILSKLQGRRTKTVRLLLIRTALSGISFGPNLRPKIWAGFPNFHKTMLTMFDYIQISKIICYFILDYWLEHLAWSLQIFFFPYWTRETLPVLKYFDQWSLSLQLFPLNPWMQAVESQRSILHSHQFCFLLLIHQPRSPERYLTYFSFSLGAFSCWIITFPVLRPITSPCHFVTTLQFNIILDLLLLTTVCVPFSSVYPN